MRKISTNSEITMHNKRLRGTVPRQIDRNESNLHRPWRINRQQLTPSFLFRRVNRLAGRSLLHYGEGWWSRGVWLVGCPRWGVGSVSQPVNNPAPWNRRCIACLRSLTRLIASSLIPISRVAPLQIRSRFAEGTRPNPPPSENTLSRTETKAESSDLPVTIGSLCSRFCCDHWIFNFDTRSLRK